MRTSRLFKDTGEIGIFLIRLFLLQTAGRWLCIGLLWLFRLFGMPGPYVLYYTNPNARHVLSTLLLAVAVAASLHRILRANRRRGKT